MNQKQLQELQRQAAKMQQDIQRIQEELGNTTVQGTAQGGAITVTMTGHRDITDLAIDPDIVDPDDIEMLQDLILAAIKDAAQKAQQLADDKMGPYTSMAGGMGGMF